MTDAQQSASRRASPNKPRILFYVQDSWGLGHLQRVAKLARALGRHAECLILCGHREAGWIVPEGCEYVRIPSLNLPLSSGSRGVFWGQHSPIEVSHAQAIEFRRELIESTIGAFCPDVIVIENRPLGMMEELAPILPRARARKVFLTRGIMTHPSRVREHYLTPSQERALGSGLFESIIVAADRRVWDLSVEYRLEGALSSRLEYAGYMSEAISAAQIRAIRAERGLSQGEKWLVCSAGGGASGERLLTEAIAISKTLKDLVMDVVLGPHSRLGWQSPLDSVTGDFNLRLHRECRALPLLHAAADVVVCPGGYNSLVEVMEGGAPIITISVQPDSDGEQHLLATRLATYYPITVMSDYAQLAGSVREAFEKSQAKASIRQTRKLDFDGLENACTHILRPRKYNA
jgi:predicted glycosyltransferase